MMAEILAQRARSENERWAAQRLATTPWDRCEQAPAATHDFPYQQIAPAWAWTRYWDERTFYAFIDWVSGLEWTQGGEITGVELALDFELFSGLEVRLPQKEAKALRDKGNAVRCMMNAVMKLAEQQRLGNCFPGAKKQARSLSFMGLTCLVGHQPRPRHRMPETGRVLLEQVKGADIARLKLVYPADWAARAQRWRIPRVPQASPDPVHFHGCAIDSRNALKCVTHHKGKCDVCRPLVHRDAPTVEACCRHHHAEDDGLPVALCTKHRMTKCADCSTPSACCIAGHHGCRGHDRGPCDACRQLPTLAERRPAACCRRGHHAPALESPGTPSRQTKKRPPPTPSPRPEKRLAPGQETPPAGQSRKRPPTTPGSVPQPKKKPQKVQKQQLQLKAPTRARGGRKRPPPTPGSRDASTPKKAKKTSRKADKSAKEPTPPEPKRGKKRLKPVTPDARMPESTKRVKTGRKATAIELDLSSRTSVSSHSSGSTQLVRPRASSSSDAVT